MNDDKFARDMARLEKARKRTQERLASQQERINQHFERAQERIEHKFGKPSVSQQRIIGAALELLKQDGLMGVSLRKLARGLDIQAPALYWHFKNKELLVDYMAEAILEKELKDMQPRRDEETWQNWLTEHMVRLRKAMLAYPDGARVVAGAHLYPVVTLAQFIEFGLISLSSVGIDLETARKIITTAITYTFGYVIEEQAAPTIEQIAEFDSDAFLKPYPYITKALGNSSQKNPDKNYLTGLQYIIAGASI